MHYGIIADIHANATALKVALDHLNRTGIDKMLFLGDLIGYGGQPVESVQMIQGRMDTLSISGNHDRMLFSDIDPHMRKTAVRAVEWTRDVLSDEQLYFLRHLPQGLTVDDRYLMVHGSLLDRDAYILNSTQIRQNLDCMRDEFSDYKICFFGHTHAPMVVSKGSCVMEVRESRTYQLDRDEVYLINPGSIGQPRDHCPYSSFGIFDEDKWTMSIFRKPYNIREAQDAIENAGLPEKFAKRLTAGY